ncbi:MAG: sulfur carrier protein ThiS [Planctomycetota bacterium]|nr:sulfur carrier protein ThiS [Planctomycetota bacterium]
MHITVNGSPQEIAEGASVADLITILDLSQRRVAVEVNKDIVRRAEHGTHQLQDADVVEIVTLVGGG